MVGGVLGHFPSHVGLHFQRDLAGSSFSRTRLFGEEVLARVIAASREDSHLMAQLSVAKAFTLPVFRGARNPDRKASSSQDSGASSSPLSTPRGMGRGHSESRGGKRKASSSPGKPGRSPKAPCHGSLLRARRGVFASRSCVPSQQ